MTGGEHELDKTKAVGADDGKIKGAATGDRSPHISMG